MTPTPLAEITADLYAELQQHQAKNLHYIAIGRACHRAGIVALTTINLPDQLLNLYTKNRNNRSQFMAQTEQLLQTERQLQADAKPEVS